MVPSDQAATQTIAVAIFFVPIDASDRSMGTKLIGGTDRPAQVRLTATMPVLRTAFLMVAAISRRNAALTEPMGSVETKS